MEICEKELEDLSLLRGSERHDHASVSCPELLSVCFWLMLRLGFVFDYRLSLGKNGVLTAVPLRFNVRRAMDRRQTNARWKPGLVLHISSVFSCLCLL